MGGMPKPGVVQSPLTENGVHYTRQGYEKLSARLIEALGLEVAEKRALLGLHDFLNRLTKGLPAPVRSVLGLRGMVAPDGRLVLKSLPQIKGEPRGEMLSIRHEKVEKGWFEIPEAYEAASVEAMAGLVNKPESGGQK